MKSIDGLHNTVINGYKIDVQLARPPGKKEKPVKTIPARKFDRINQGGGNGSMPTPLMASIPHHRSKTNSIIVDYTRNLSMGIKDNSYLNKNYNHSDKSEPYDPCHPTDSQPEYSDGKDIKLDTSNCSIRKMPPELLASQTLGHRNNHNPSYHLSKNEPRTDQILEHNSSRTDPWSSKQPIPLISSEVPTNGRKRTHEDLQEYSQDLKKRPSISSRQPPLLMEMTKGRSSGNYKVNTLNRLNHPRFSSQSEDSLSDIFINDRPSSNSIVNERIDNDKRKPPCIIQQLRNTDRRESKISRNIVPLFSRLPLS